MQSLNFKRIGHISFDSNERSNYSARELKSVYVDFFAYLLKLQVGKCFVNKFNNFKQAGIVSLKCIASRQQLPYQKVQAEIPPSHPVPVPQEAPLPVEPKKEEQEPVPTLSHNAPQSEQKTETPIDASTMQEIRILEKEKAKAVETEDFDEALRLKNIIIRLKAAGKQLSELEAKKREAVRNEDYEAAKKYKLGIEKLKGSILAQEAPTQIRISRQGKRSEPQMAVFAKSPEEEEDAKRIESNQAIIHSFIRDSRMAEPAVRKAKSRSPERAEFVQSGEEHGEEYFDEQEENKAMLQQSYDERVVPALLKKRQGGEQSQAQIAEEEEPPAKKEQPEPLSEATLILAEPYRTVFTMPLLELLFSKHYYLKEEGLEIISQEISSKKYEKLATSDPEKILNAIIGIVIHMVQTKILTIGNKGLGLLLQAMSQYKVDKKSSILSSSTIEYMLDSLFERLGEGNALLNSKIEESLLGLVKQGTISLGTLISQLIKNGKKSHKVTKHALKRLQLMIQVLKTFEREVKELQMEDIVEYALTGIRHTNRDIRLEGYKILVEIYKIMGDKIDGYLVDLMPIQRKALDEELKKAFGAKVGLKQPEESGKEETKVTKKESDTGKTKKPKEDKKEPKKPTKEDKPAKEDKKEIKKTSKGKDEKKPEPAKKQASPTKKLKQQFNHHYTLYVLILIYQCIISFYSSALIKLNIEWKSLKTMPRLQCTNLRFIPETTLRLSRKDLCAEVT
eukprot:TRINITY_DN1937_c0_g1_i1.p1 TRINITY_DN1937_c0_g1~~TRINITY_DN1937_c0_g1_i1.p1  ORF type:complete len:735 (-),score=128.50 TRINITY_DN1937_c0_g1_i1:5890-8094(-)